MCDHQADKLFDFFSVSLFFYFFFNQDCASYLVSLKCEAFLRITAAQRKDLLRFLQ